MWQTSPWCRRRNLPLPRRVSERVGSSLLDWLLAGCGRHPVRLSKGTAFGVLIVAAEAASLFKAGIPPVRLFHQPATHETSVGWADLSLAVSGVVLWEFHRDLRD
jgi:hypothetical protein